MQRFILGFLALVHVGTLVPTASAFTPQGSVSTPAVVVDGPAIAYPSERIAEDGSYEEMCGSYEPNTVDVRVRAGETLGHFARWASTTVDELAILNELDPAEALVPGQALLLPIYEEELAAVEGARVADAEAKLARYIAGNGGLAAIAAHEVKRGETGWDIARKQAQVPMWVLASFNTKVEMDALQPGDTLYLPVLGQTLSDRFDAQVEASLSAGNAQADVRGEATQK